MKIAFVYNRKRDNSLEQAEFDTPETIGAIDAALRSAGHEVIDVEMNLATQPYGWIRQLMDAKPDLIFNTAEGYHGVGRESLGPTVYEQLQLKYVGSGPYGCFLTLDKFLTKQMVASRGVPVIEGFFIQSTDELQFISREMSYPVFVKPNYEGSSKGITQKSVCNQPQDLLEYGGQCLKAFPAGILVERFIPGRDVAVPYIAGLGEGGVLEPLEYVYSKAGELNIYDYELKNFDDNAVSVKCPAAIDPNVRLELMRLVKAIVPAVGAADFSRVDFRITPDNEIYFLEINALPSLQPGAGIFDATKLLGLDYNQTILKIVDASVQRFKLGGSPAKISRRLRTRPPRIALVYNLKRRQHDHPGYQDEAEFDSQETVDHLANTIAKIGGQVFPIEATRTLAEELKESRTDIVFNIAEGSRQRSREAQVPAICDLLGIEHTGSDATCLAITLDKAVTKKLLIQDGLLTPGYRLYQGGKSVEPGLRFPVIAKPNHEGTSKGIHQKCVATNSEELDRIVKELWDAFKTPVLCEEYVEGREFTIGILGTSTLKTLGPLEIVFQSAAGKFPVYSFEAKTSPVEDNPLFRVDCPVSLGKAMDRKISNLAKKAFRSVGCRDVARIDFRLTDKGEVYFLEINPLPGLSPGFSDLAILADRSGLGYTNLIRRILSPAIGRWRNAGRIRKHGT
jgi:D-alanine-D-alanine ligase